MEEKIQYTLGKKIRLYRKLKKMTQEELAEKLDLSIGFIAVLESGKRGIRLDTLMKVCTVLEITPNDLLVDRDFYEGAEVDKLLLESIRRLNVAQKRVIFNLIDTIV